MPTEMENNKSIDDDPRYDDQIMENLDPNIPITPLFSQKKQHLREYSK